MITRSLFLLFALALGVPGSAFTQSETVVISTDFPGGNGVVLKNEGGSVRLKPDLRGGRDWFYWHFQATASKPGPVEFVFEGALRIGVRGPAMSLDQGKTWQWLGTDSVRYADKKSKEPPTESFAFTFTEAGQEVRFAVAIPYLQQELDDVLSRTTDNPHLTRSVLCETRGGKPVELLRIGHPGTNKEAIIVTARHHACESMASYVLEGFLTEAMSESTAARAFRDRYVLYAVPMMDKDGVQAGDQGKWRFPHDHNRDYGDKSIYPEVQALQKLAQEVDVRLALDFHCPSLRGDTHEVFYFIGVGLPHLHDNTEELRGWIAEEQPPSVRSSPFNFMRDPPPSGPGEMIDTKFSVWFAYLEGVRYAATFEIPYSQANVSFDAAMARDYGTAVLRGWERSEFINDPSSRSEFSHAQLIKFRKEFSASYKSRPDEAEAVADNLLKDPKSPPVFKVEAENSLGLLRLRQRKLDEAMAHFETVITHADATTEQRLTALTQRVLTSAKVPVATPESILSSIRDFEAFPYPSPTAQFDAFGAASAFFAEANDTDRALAFAQKQLPAASKYQRGETLLRIADFFDQRNQPDAALDARQTAVTHLRQELDPLPVGIFGASMARDLFEALPKIPGTSAKEKKEAAQLVLDHKISSKEMKARALSALDGDGLARRPK